MSVYNVIAFESLSITSEIENRTIVCGTFLSTAGTYGNKRNQSAGPPFTYTLEINGSTSPGNTFNVLGGNLGLGPYPSNRITKKDQGNMSYRIDNQIDLQLNQGNIGAVVQIDNTLPSRCADIISGIKSLSTSLSQLPPNNFVTIPSGQSTGLVFNVTNVDANGIAVFNVSLTSVFGNSYVQSIKLNPLASNIQLVVINLYGLSVSWSGSNFVDPWFETYATSLGKTVWNFYQATTLTFGPNMRGAVLAPYAAVITNSNIDGSVAVRSLRSQAEVHMPLLTFPGCTSTPNQTATS